MTDNDTVPIYVKTLFGRRVVVCEKNDIKKFFLLPKINANYIKIASGFSKRKKLYVRYQNKDLQIMEILDRKSSSLFNHSAKNSGGYIFKNTNRN